jgi:glycosyltransferase involved in cell wall biosynthesis
MRLLILTQAVDKEDPVLGFFHRWLEVFSSNVEHIDVVCLKQGVHSLPSNVTVHSLGKENGRSRLKYIFNFYRYVFLLSYDAVFIHMNEEYVLLAGPWWRLTGKKVLFWRNFRTGTWRTRLAVALSTKVFYTSVESYTAQFKKAVQMPVGIDTSLFVPPENPAPLSKILFLGRLDEIKKPHVFIEALSLIKHSFEADIFGTPTDPDLPYAQQIEKMAEPLVAAKKLALHPGVDQEKARVLYQNHAIYVNVTLGGSFDKTIIEALACGAIVVCVNEAVRGSIPDQCIVTLTPESIAAGITWALERTDAERQEIVRKGREYAVEQHSLQLLEHRLASILTT